MRSKCKEWFLRYGFAELLALLTTLLGASITLHYTQDLRMAAIAGALSDNIGYYGWIISREMNDPTYKGSFFQRLFKRLRNLFFEFGISEVLDTFLIRPFLLYVGPILLNNFTIGIISGKILADLTFYLITISFYEMRKKIWKH